MNVLAHECGALQTVERRNCSGHINLSTPPPRNSNSVVDIDYKGSRDVHVTTGHNPNGLDTIHGPKLKNGGATPRQILDLQLF
jgi:hypothetical protein